MVELESERSRREREPSRESRENKEVEHDPELAAAAAMERADQLSREVKQSKKQMQNILVNMQQVTAVIAQLRKQLQLADSEDPASVQQDREVVEKLKAKIADHVAEIEAMEEDLVREQMEQLRDGVGVGMTTEQLEEKARGMVGRMIEEIKA